MILTNIIYPYWEHFFFIRLGNKKLKINRDLLIISFDLFEPQGTNISFRKFKKYFLYLNSCTKQKVDLVGKKLNK
jgi:hypothetical protein